MERGTSHYNVLMQSMTAKVYGLLQQAAFNRLFVTYRDVSPLLLGYSPDKATPEQTAVLWHILERTMSLDAARGLPPLAALFISKVGARPRAPFFSQYLAIYGQELSREDWESVVNNVYNSHSLEPLD